MNHIFSVLWNSALGRFCVTSELGRGRSRASTRRVAHKVPGLRVLTACVALACSAQAWSQTVLPQGAKLTAGMATVNYTDTQMTVKQSSAKAILDWQSFQIGAGHQVRFEQPSASSVALNRVLGADASVIHGTLQANGQVFLVNPNGVLFGAGANVNVGGLVASTLGIADSDFLAGRYQFTGKGSTAQGGTIVNQGRMTAADGGAVALLGGSVSNQGTIAARLGSVSLAAGSQIALDFAGDGLLNVQVQQSAVNALVENRQLIQADGGNVLMTAKATDALLQTVVNNTGTVQARTIENRKGKIVLLGVFNGGTTRVAGTLDASAPDTGDGGFVDTSGANVQIAAGTRVTTLAAQGKTGTWLIDPTDFTISAGSGARTDSGIGADTLTANLVNNNMELQTLATGTEAGHMHVNAAVSWRDHKLTLNAHGNININAVMSVTDTGTLALNYGGTQGNAAATAAAGSNLNVNAGGRIDLEKSGTGKLDVNGHGYTVINTLADLSAIQNLGGKYALGSDIDASPTASTAQGFAPIGAANTPFTGVFDGLGHTISQLTINRPNASDVGLFGGAENAVLRNIGLEQGSTAGSISTGALVGYLVGSSVSNAYATGSITGVNDYTGGLIGQAVNSSISNVYATGSVKGVAYTGGLVGGQYRGSISNAHATGDVTSTRIYGGGLIGFQYLGNISNAYATGRVTGNTITGGLVGGLANGSSISNAYATGSVKGDSDVGGLVGNNSASRIINTYATGSVTGNSNIGGLIGFQTSGTINSVYATGSVGGSSNARGLIGLRLGGSVSYAYWNTETTGQQASDATRLTIAQMFDTSKWAGFDFGTVWGNANGQTTPYLLNMAGNQVFNKNDLPTGTITIDNRPVLYTAVLDVNQLQAAQNNLSGRYLLGNDIDASATAGWNGGKGFAPIGTLQSTFTGVFDGLGHTISRLTINRPDTTEPVGLFGDAENAVLRNVGLVEGSTIGRLHTGALVGYQNGGSISKAYATGSVTGIDRTGGLVGAQSGGDISNAYAAGSVTGSFSTGGLVGLSSGSISNAYATGSVTGTISTGGLLGYQDSGRITNAYATGSVTGTISSGGLVGAGDSHSSISNAYWNTETTGQQTSARGIGLTTAQMKEQASFEGWNISNAGGSAAVWRIYEGHTAPLLRSFLTPVTIGGEFISAYNGSTMHGISDWQKPTASDGSQLLGTLRYTTTEKNVGRYSGNDLSASGLYTTQQGYDISYAPGASLRIVPKEISQVTGITANDRKYDGTNGAGLNTDGATFSGAIVGDQLTVAHASASFRDKNAGTDKEVHITGIALGGADKDNYLLAQATASTTASISQRDIAVAITADSKTYDTTTVAATHGSLGNSILAGDQVSLNTSGSFADKNAGTRKTVTVNGALTGADANNYRLLLNKTTTADIDKLAISASITASNKTYDGTNDTATQGMLGALLGNDKVTLTTSGSFADKNAGTSKTVTVNGALTGSDADNYRLVHNATTTAAIDRLSVNGAITANNKTYDGTTAAATQGALGALIGSDNVTLASSGSFADKNAGTSKTVTVNGTLTGSDADNYRLVHNATTTADIDRLAINGAITANNKTYDGNNTAATLGALGGLIGSDKVTLATSGSFADANTGTAKTVHVSGTLSGADASNYRLVHNATTTATIHAPAVLEVAPESKDPIVIPDKVYASLDYARQEKSVINAGSVPVSAGCFNEFPATQVQVLNLSGITQLTMVSKANHKQSAASAYAVVGDNTCAYTLY